MHKPVRTYISDFNGTFTTSCPRSVDGMAPFEDVFGLFFVVFMVVELSRLFCIMVALKNSSMQYFG